MTYATVNDLTMYYEEHGPPGADPLVLLHGFTVTGDYWSHQIPDYSERYRLLVPDLRGHGRTNNPGGLATMNHRQFARDIIALCETLGIERAIFCGESTGAMLLLSLAVEAPSLTRALVLSGGTYFFGKELRDWWSRQTPDTILGESDPRRRGHTAMGPDHWRLVAEAFIAVGTHTHAEDFPEADELTSIAAPTLLVHGDRDSMFPIAVPTGLHGLLPNAELCILPNTGHHPPREQAGVFNAIVLDFLTRRVT